ncbi:hypothetical protein [Helicobacter sp. 11S02596-1]|uniref:hypothetical protein n=1 Tax=Helicobacter sp. 11S02596-1 TaxID=1476194 RepID=UPI000BA7A5C8|nr:hypothetical protein [Helicobacter sp. 11S02596-1]PAF43179.1 hypothetical protein BJI48_05390 [Helicobacter sp. 11S02596-1]
MKITPRNASVVSDTLASKKPLHIVPEKKSDTIKHSEDAVKITQNELSQSTKETNNAIGALQTAMKGIDTMTKEGKALVGILKNQENAPEAHNLKQQLIKTFDSTTFNGENVFAKNYTRLDPHIKFDANAIKPSNINTENPQAPEDFLKNLGIQKKYAKEAIHILNQNLQNNLENLKKTDATYDALDKTALNEKQFKEAHKTEGLTLERLAKLLG